MSKISAKNITYVSEDTRAVPAAESGSASASSKTNTEDVDLLLAQAETRREEKTTHTQTRTKQLKPQQPASNARVVRALERIARNGRSKRELMTKQCAGAGVAGEREQRTGACKKHE